MTAVVEDVQPWSRVRWVTAITIAVAVQFGLVLVFTHRAPLRPRTGLNTQVILPEKVAEEFQTLTDPTLLALGGPRSFSAIWLELPRLPPVDANWKQPPHWLSLESDTLGSGFLELARSNAASVHGLAFKTTPQVLPAATRASPSPLRAASTLTVSGDLASRTLLDTQSLPSWPATDLLLSSVVRLVVDARGRVISAILQSSSGSADADQFAVAQSQRMRFSPVHHGVEATPLTLGQLVFEWHTTKATEAGQKAGPQ